MKCNGDRHTIMCEKSYDKMIEYNVQVCSSGTKKWLLNGVLHREDGPAVEYADGSKGWYLNGKQVTVFDVLSEKEATWWGLKYAT